MEEILADLTARLKSLELENESLKVESHEARDLVNRVILGNSLNEESSGSKEPKASLPEKFDGTRKKFRGFINQLELFYEFLRTAAPAEPPARASGADLCLQPVCAARPVLWVLETAPSHISRCGISKPVVAAKQWGFQCHPQSEFFGNIQAYPYLSDSEKRRIALGNTFNSKEGLQISQLIRRKTKILLPEMIRKDQKSPPQVDMCFASVAEIEAQSSEVVEVVEAVEAATVQHHQSVHCTGDLVQALKTVRVPAIRQKSGLVKDKTILVHTTAPKRSQSNRTQKPLAPKHKLAIKIAPSTSTEQVTSHTHGKLLCQPPKKGTVPCETKKPQTHSVTQASGRQNISGDVRNHPDLISTAKKNRYNTNRDACPHREHFCPVACSKSDFSRWIALRFVDPAGRPRFVAKLG
ncbi:hypothetical protein BASA81_014541 [Batrachochytrium salamandrivorans]|nr:hypothetical protein BASA81_014541 [Batrachochytrium salamandrivorans]